MRVLISGSSGCLGSVLVPALCADPAIEAVTGVDLRASRFAHAKYRHLQLDLDDLGVQRLSGHDALVHLAYVVLRGRMSEVAMSRINVRASANLLRRAKECGIGRTILLSSAAVYGCGVNLDERAPYAPLAGFSYGRHKAELEGVVETQIPDCLRLRPHVIFGRHAQPLLRFLLRQPLYPRLPMPEPELQCVHEDDVASAIRLALFSQARGALNLASTDAFSFAQIMRRTHRMALPAPPALLAAALHVGWRVGGWGGEPGWMRGLCQPLTLSCARARHELGWTPRHTRARRDHRNFRLIP